MPLTAIAMPEEQQQPAQPAPQPQAQTVPDPAHVILSAAQTDDKSKADAWEIYHNHEGKEFEDKLAATSLPQDAKSALWQAKTRDANTKAQRAQQVSQAPKQDVVENFLDNEVKGTDTPSLKPLYQAGKGLYHGLMGDEESTHGQPTTAYPATPNLGFTPEHIGQTAGEFGRGLYQFGKGLVQDVTGVGGKRLPLLVPEKTQSEQFNESIAPQTEKGPAAQAVMDPHAQTLIGKYVMAPSMAERAASEKELEQYYQTHGTAAFGHALNAFIHGTLGEYVPLIGPLAGDIMDTGVRGDIGGALTKVAGLYATEKAGEAGKDAIAKRVAPYVAKVTEGMKTPAVKQAEANVEVTTKNREAAQKVHDAVQAQHDAHIASHEQGVASPSNITSKLEKTQAALDEATFHDEAAKARLEKAQKDSSLPRRAGQAVAKVLPRTEAPVAPEAPITAAPELKPLGQPQAALPQLGEPQTPPMVSPAHATTTIPQEPIGRPQGPSGPVQLPGGEPVGKMKLLGEGTPIGPQVPEGGLPKIKEPETPAPKTPKPERGRLGELKVDEKGNVVEKDPQGAHLQRLLEESLKNTKGNENFPAATVEEAPSTDRRQPSNPNDKIGVREKMAYDNAMEKRAAEGGKTRVEGTEDRRQEEVPVEDERRQGERRVLKGINERTFQESAFGGEGEKGIDTDAYAKATEQARKELGPDATKEAVIARRNELVGDKAKGSTGDIGAQAREANPEPTRAETKKPVLPKEEPTGYEGKKEELVSAGEEGREPAKSASEYHPAVEQKVSELSDEKLKTLATKHGLNPDEYDFKARDARRHRVERDQLAKDITEQMDDEEKINIGRAAQAAEKEPGFENRDQSAAARAARAEKLFPRLREQANGATAGYGSKNKGVTAEEYKQAKFNFMDKASKSNAGVDPSMLADLAKVGAYHFEAGLREFADWSKKMVEDLGEGWKPYLQEVYDKVSKAPEEPKKATGFSQKADKRYPATSGVDAEAEKLKEHVGKTSTKDTDHVQAAMKELGPDAKLSDVMKRAQELKDAAAKPVSKEAAAAQEDYDKERAFAQQVLSGEKKVEDFPYHESYKKTIEAESKQLKPGSKVLFIGGGPMPVSSIEFANRGFDVDTMELDPETTKIGQQVAEKSGAKTGKFITSDARSFDKYKDYDAVVVALEAGPEGSSKNEVLKQVMDNVKPGAKVLARGTAGEGGESFVDTSKNLPKGTHVTSSIDTFDGLSKTHTLESTDQFSASQHNENGGSSIHPEKGNLAGKDGYAVSVNKSLEHVVDSPTITAEDIKSYKERPDVKKALDKSPNSYVGTWRDGDKSYLDVSQVETDLDKAKSLAKENSQLAIFDLKNMKEIKTDSAAFPDTIERPTVKVPKGSKPLPTGNALIKKYGEGGTDPKHTTFILDDGRTVANTGSDHDTMLGGKATDKNAPRERFVQQGNIRVRAHQGTAGREVAFSIPESGINAAQWEQLKKMSPQLGSGAVMIEVGKPGGKYEVIPYGEASPERLKQAIQNVTGKGEAPQSVGAARAGTPLAKEQPLTPKQLQERLPDIAQEHLTDEEKAGLTTNKKGKANEKTVAKFVKNLLDIPSVQEYIDIAKLGEGARKWYSRSSAAFDALKEAAPKYFGETGDKEKFTGMLAGSSPQQAVVSNMRETLGLWKAWVDAGRPKLDIERWKAFNDAADKAWEEDGSPRVGGTLKGASMHWDYAPTGPEWKNERMLLENLTLPNTKVPNIIKALNGEHMWPDITKNEAFKAPSFAENLRKWLDGVRKPTKGVTNDSWMGLFGGVDKKALASPESYHPLSVATRAAAEALGWEPEEAQAAIWAFTQALTEKGTEDPEVVRHYSEDFKDILENDNEVRSLLEDLGVNLDDIDARLKQIEEKPQVTAGGSPTSADSVRKLRERIETARGKNAIPEPKSIQGNLFRENPNFEHRNNPGAGHTETAPTELELRKQEEQTKADAAKLKAEKNKQKELGTAKGPLFKDSGTDFNTSEFDEEERLKKLGEKKKPGLKQIK